MFSQSIESIFETLKNVNDVIHMISIPLEFLTFLFWERYTVRNSKYGNSQHQRHISR